jgi:hypothetical protein
MKTIYVTTAEFEIEIDPAKPEEVAKAAEFMSALSKGTVPQPVDGVKITAKPARIVNRRDEA